MAGHKGKQRGRQAPARRGAQAHLETPAEEQGGGAVRLNKYIARAGVCSRRNADALIDQGLVKINDQTASEYWYQVQPGDVVVVNGRVISPRSSLVVVMVSLGLLSRM